MIGTELYWIESPWHGRLAIMPRPRGGDWLEDEVRSWRSQGVHAVISTLTNEEIDELDLAKEPELCAADGVEFFTFPVPDRGVPPSIRATGEFVRDLEARLARGEKVIIHCRAGIGRSAILAACLLTLSGMTPEAAFERTERARGCPVPDTAEQREWVGRFARDVSAARTLSDVR